jgi:NitT/TauT family transport system permease protein
MIWALLTMFLVILLYDQLIFRPLLAWIEKFKSELDEDKVTHESWFLDLLTKTKLLKIIEKIFSHITEIFVNPPRLAPKVNYFKITDKFFDIIAKYLAISWNFALFMGLACSLWYIVKLIHNNISLMEVLYVLQLGFITALKVVILIIIASLIWIPIGAWIGFNVKASLIMQPIIQFLAAFPVNFFYPIAVILIIKYDLNKNIWTAPLMILGTQWYILFNVIAGTSQVPKEFRLVCKNLGVKSGKWLWWKRLMLPAIFPYYITGAMTAAGGSWNASIVAEFLRWGDHTIVAVGLGSYITRYTQTGDFPRIALGISVMCVYVMLFNRLVWQRLYNMAATRFTMD